VAISNHLGWTSEEQEKGNPKGHKGLLRVTDILTVVMLSGYVQMLKELSGVG
jgi:hypothetical protein